MSREIGLSFFAAIFSLLLFSWLMYDVKYAFYLGVITIPSFYILTKLPYIEGKETQDRQVRNFRILSIASPTLAKSAK